MELSTSDQPIFKPTSSRLYLLDEARGICILYVMLYHLLYDLDILFNIIDFPYFWSHPMQFLRIGFVMILMIISGISCSLSKNNFKRSLKLLGVALMITFITYIVVGSDYVLFGILHFFATAILIYCAIGKQLKKLPRKTFSIIFLLLFIITFNIYDGSITLLGWVIDMPEFLYNKLWLVPVGFGMTKFSSIDYYPIFPWIFVFFIGVLYGDFLKSHHAPTIFYKHHSHFLTYIGKHTLSLYLLHQPLFYTLIWVYISLR